MGFYVHDDVPNEAACVLVLSHGGVCAGHVNGWRMCVRIIRDYAPFKGIS